MNRLLLVGWDGADWKIINALLARGQMPHLASVLENGVQGNLATIYPSLSPLLWTSIATGKRPQKHGICGFIEPTPDGMNVRPVSILGRKSKAVWNILNQHDKRSLVVGWWPSHPAEPIRGAMVSNHFRFTSDDEPAKAMGAGTVSPRSWASRLSPLRVHATEISPEILRLFIPDLQKIDQEKDKSLHDLADIIANMMSIHAASTLLLEQEPWDFAAIYFDGIDQICHRFMPYYARKAKDPEAGLLEGVVLNAYRYQDAMLGRAMALAGEDCAVMVISDHGFHSDHLLPDYIAAEMDGRAVEHRHFGIFCLRAPGVKRGATIYGASILDITPTILHLFGLPVGLDMDGQALIHAFVDPALPEAIPSWEAIGGEDGRHPENHQYDGLASVESLRQLVALGYVAPPNQIATDNVNRCMKEWDYNLACAHLDSGSPELAIRVLRDLIRQDTEDGRFYQLLVTSLLLSGDLEECARTLDDFDASCARFGPAAGEELFQRRSTCPDAHLIQTGDGDAWIELRERQHLSEKAAAFVGERLLLRCRLATAQRLRYGESQHDARALLEELATRFGRCREAVRVLAEGFMILGDQQRALACIHQLKNDDPDDWQALALEAWIQYERGRDLEAIERCVESLSLVYHQPLLHYVLGLALRRAGEDEKARQAFAVAVCQMPGLAALQGEVPTSLQANPSCPQPTISCREQAKFTTCSGEDLPELESAPAPKTVPQFTVFERTNGGVPADRNQVVTIVTGLPRSGTSMMMQMLIAAGFESYTDGRRIADEDNARGYFEHEHATRLHEDNSWLPLARGKVVKIVAQLLPQLPSGFEYRLVFMHRDMDEILASQHSMLRRLGQTGAKLDKAQLGWIYLQQLARVQTWLRLQSGMHVLAVQYADTLKSPAIVASRLASFLGEPFDQAAAAAAVESSLRHHHHEEQHASTAES